MAERNDWPGLSAADAERLAGEEPGVNRGQSALYAEVTAAISRLRGEMGLTPADVLGALEGAKLNYWGALAADAAGGGDPEEEAPKNA